MIKRILVALDPDLDTPTATQVAAVLAKRFDAEVTALAVVDTRQIAADVGPGGAIGGQHFAERVRRSLSTETQAAARALVDGAAQAFADAEVRFSTRIAEGAAAEQIVEALRYHDLLVVGGEPHFYYANPAQETKTLVHIVKHSVAPALLVPERFDAVRRVLVAFDGSDAATRTLQRFAQLHPFGRSPEVQVVHVHASSRAKAAAVSEQLVERATAYLRAHGFANVRGVSHTGGDPAAELLALAKAFEADLLVAGAHSVSAARRLVFGSTTHSFLRDGGRPLFVFH